eukprot:Gregarina_sp_Poly_1__10458@NODE_75_length_15886_cov_79_326569_g64_i0_p7_GENE_NODE_75_length_15886_cov_79_326569_g64_i0NODE_75_length_15886_cov_79_326569_g64_i0_p7_ORF_typecomplete_len125_score6_96_NODE_75_length_15886_cov_79_326569_g64_i0986810242
MNRGHSDKTRSIELYCLRTEANWRWIFSPRKISEARHNQSTIRTFSKSASCVRMWLRSVSAFWGLNNCTFRGAASILTIFAISVNDGTAFIAMDDKPVGCLPINVSSRSPLTRMPHNTVVAQRR